MWRTLFPFLKKSFLVSQNKCPKKIVFVRISKSRMSTEYSFSQDTQANSRGCQKPATTGWNFSFFSFQHHQKYSSESKNDVNVKNFLMRPKYVELALHSGKIKNSRRVRYII
jgi:hypothetical protein